MLRERLALPGSKNACEQGECGSCSVYLDGELVCSCLVLAGQAEGREIVTVEGLAGEDELHPVQEAFLEAGAVQCGFCTPGLIVATHDLLARNASPSDPEIREALAGNLCRCTGYEKILDAVRLAASRRMSRLVIEGCAIATVDAEGTEHADGHIVIRHGWIDAVGPGPAPRRRGEDEVRIDGRGRLATPGLVNCHHHLYQWATRGLAQQATLFEWLQELYPVWAHVDAEIERAAARAGLAALARSGCSTASDHHYLFPRDAGDLLEVEIEAAREIGLRFHPCRGSMDLGRSAGGLPPDEVTEDRDADPRRLRGGDRPLPRHLAGRDAADRARPVLAVLGHRGADARRRRSWRGGAACACTRTWPRPRTRSASASSASAAGRSSTSSALGWLGDDVWLAHCVHLDEREVQRFGETRHRRRPLPELQRAAGRGHRARGGAGRAPARRSGSASTAPPPTRRASWAASCARRCSWPGWPGAIRRR